MSAGSSVRRVGRALRGHPFWSVVAVIVVLAGATAGVYFGVIAGDSTPAAAAAIVRTETVSTGTIRQSVSASGTLAPATDDSLNFSSAGVVTAVNVTEGQTVTQGQALATINSASLAATVAQAQATVASDQAKVADESSTATATQIAADNAALAAAQNQLTAAQTALSGATLTAPIAGIVASVNLTVGQSVSGSSSGSGAASSGGSTSGSSSSSSAQIQVISANTWIVNSTVDATSVGLIKAGDQAQLAITGASSTVYGTISSVAVLPSSTTGTASYAVVISVTGAQTGLYDGSAVTATLIYKQLTNVVEVSALALHRATDGTEYVEKMVNGKPVKTTVEVGISSGAETQITSGLAAGDQIQVEQPAAVANRGTTGTTGTTTRRGTGGTGTTGGGFGGFGGAGGTGGFGGGAGGFGGAGGAGNGN